MGIFSIIGVKKFNFIEIGVQDSIECNSTNLLLNLNWSGAQFEGCKESYEDGKRFFKKKGVKKNQCQLINKFVNAENVNSLIKKTGIKGEIDFFSLDIDGNDYWVWKSISIIKPRLVVLEYNASFGEKSSLTIPYNSKFVWDNKDEKRFFYGASLKALKKISKKKGYNLVCVDSKGINAFFVRKDLVKNTVLKKIKTENLFVYNKEHNAKLNDIKKIVKKYNLVNV
tara:strand:+ start:330 stop:1007 length:678 start_codon:yes stop_codon:yes gene_type:complete